MGTGGAGLYLAMAARGAQGPPGDARAETARARVRRAATAALRLVKDYDLAPGGVL